MIPIYTGMFFIILHWLKVDSSRLKRSLVLASTLAGIELFCNLIVFTLDLDGVVNTILSVSIFVFVIRRFLILKLWQAIVIPIGVTTVSYLIVAIFLMMFFQFFSGQSNDI
jgi:hypothetical protein